MEHQIVAWERTDEYRGLSMGRLEQQPNGWLAYGSEVIVQPVAETSSFRVVLSEDWISQAASVRAFDADGERTVELAADSDRTWTVDGAPRTDLADCLDLDVAAAPVTNTFPIRRLGDLPVGDSVTLAVAWIDVPSLEVSRVDQTYRRLDAALWEYSDPAQGTFQVSVDDAGMVVDYQNLARRVSEERPRS